MDISFERLDISDKQIMSKWDELINRKAPPSFAVYCTSNWIKLLNNSYGYEPFLYFVKDKGNIIGLIPIVKVKSLIFGNRFMSLPITDHSCGPIVFDGNSYVYEKVYEFLVHISKKEKIDYIRLHNPPENSWKIIEKFSGVVPYNYYTFRVHLNKDEESFLNGLNKKRRGDIRRSEKKTKDFNISIRNNIHKSLMDQIYDVHRKHMKFLGSPAHNKKFFAELLKQKNIFVLGEFENRIVAFYMFIESGNEIRWVIGNFDPKYKNRLLGTCILWKIIKSNLNSNKVFDFGGTIINGNYSFKMGWLGKNFANGELLNLKHYHIFFRGKNVLDPQKSQYIKMANIWKKYVPSSFANFVGPRIRSAMGV